MSNDDLSMDEWLFIAEYMKDGKPQDAIVRAGYSGKFAREEGYRVLRRARVQREIKKLQESIREKLQSNTNAVISDIMAVLAADPRDLYEIRQASCRHCHGEEHRYQRTLNEYRSDEFKCDVQGKYFDPMGGIGYNPNQDPHPDCPECFGKGIMVEEIKDVRTLTAEQAVLYMGGERTKYGLKIQMRSKDAAREAAARYLGMNKETINHNIKKETEMTDAELEAIVRGSET